MIKSDYVIVGSGITGATVARLFTDAGREVIVLERRNVAGGNVVDAVHEPSGIRYGVHGVHYFRTSCSRIWEFATRFGDFFPYEARVLSSIDGELVPWPPQRSWIEKLCGKDWQPEFTGKPASFEEACLSMMPRAVFSRAVEPYSVKQWGRPCRELSASLCKRFDVRDGDTRLTPHAKYQGLPRDGYSAWMANMLKGIDVRTGFDYLRRREEVQARRKLIFTGPIDEYFGFSLGKLAYRAQKREHRYLETFQYVSSCAQINFPQHDAGPLIRMIEWKRLMPPDVLVKGTFWTEEVPYTPTNPDCYEYPFPDAANDRLRAAYHDLAKTLPGVVFCGRLGTYKYLDMDQAIGQAMVVARKLLNPKEEDSDNGE